MFSCAGTAGLVIADGRFQLGRRRTNHPDLDLVGIHSRVLKGFRDFEGRSMGECFCAAAFNRRPSTSTSMTSTRLIKDLEFDIPVVCGRLLGTYDQWGDAADKIKLVSA
jgi:hypothetical protein